MKGSILKALCLSLILLLLPMAHNLSPVYADESTPSADILNQIKNEAASIAAKLKSQVDKKLENKALSGLVQSKTDDKIILTTTNRNQIVLINQYTDYQIKTKNQKISQDDFIIALGDLDDKGNLVARRVIKTIAPDTDLTQYVWGRIGSVSSSSITLTTKDSKAINVLVSHDTTYQLGKNEGSITDVTQNKFLIAVGEPKGDNLTARFIYLIPSIGVINPKVASSSALASPSASPSKKK